MDFEDLLQPEVAVGAAVAAALFSPRVRGLLRRGVVYTVAGALVAGDAVTSLARGVGEGVQKAGTAASSAANSAGRRVPVATDGQTATDAHSASSDNTVEGTAVEETDTSSTNEAGE